MSTLNPDILAQFPYQLDEFQRDAAVAIEAGDHVLVTAHTSAGKSTVALYAIAKALLENKRVIYTAPVKTLSNQKYADLKALYSSTGTATVGIQTGDVKMNPEAQIVVMTTEILRNGLCKGDGLLGDMSNLGYVIFDECHYINDKDRGAVWEECMMRLPLSVQMIMLSATMANPEELAGWLESRNPAKKVPIISTLQRPVPLRFQVFVPDPNTFSESLPWDEAIRDGHMATVLDSESGRFDAERYIQMSTRYTAAITHQLSASSKSRDLTTGRKGVADKNSSKAAGKARQPFNMINMLNPFLNFLHINSQLPAIVFTLSRKKCDIYAKRVTTCLVTPEESANIDKTFNFYIRKLENPDQYEQVTRLKSCLAKGVGVHHSGMLPILKEIVEILFTRGLLKVMFATETLAIGINTPTRTVCFPDVVKHDGVRSRSLVVEEFKQMAGRAGRRGLDTVGHVIYFPVNDPVTSTEFNDMVKGRIRRITSKFAPTTGYVLRALYARASADAGGGILENAVASLRHQENMREATAAVRVLAETEAKRRDILTRMNELSNNEGDEPPYYGDMYSDLQDIERKTVKNYKQAKRIYENRIANMRVSQASGYMRYLANCRELERVEELIAEVTRDGAAAPELMKSALNVTVDYLVRNGYVVTADAASNEDSLCRSNLTIKGLFAQEINQAHEIMLTEAIFSEGERTPHPPLDSEPENLAAWLAVFIDEGGSAELTVPAATSLGADVVEQSERIQFELQTAYIDSSELRVSLRYVDPVYEWCKGAHIQSIAAGYCLFEGNILRALQKLVNLIDELEKGFTLIQRLDWVKALDSVRALVKRDVLNIESIYVA